MAVALGFTRWAGRADTADRATEAATPAATTTVTRNDISTARTLPGTLGYGAARTVTSSRSGVITWLPSGGTTISRGDRVYSVNDEPVLLFYGRIPLYRDLQTKGTVGRDVRVVYDNLRALGYAVGAQPSPGTVVNQPVEYSAPPAAQPDPSASASNATPNSDSSAEQADTTTRTRIVKRKIRGDEAMLTPTLIKAIGAWQHHLDLPAAGRLTVGSVLVLPAAIRVAALSAQVGDPATGELLSITPTSKVITVQADESQAAAVENGDRVTVALSDGATTPARVTSVSTALQTPDGGSASAPKLAITLVLDRPSKLRRVDSADLQVSFAAETHKHVLTVPISALLALQEGGYALQTPAGALIAVRTGIFADGRVEVSGPGVTAGLAVVTTS
jgi:hypothetical protein